MITVCFTFVLIISFLVWCLRFVIPEFHVFGLEGEFLVLKLWERLPVAIINLQGKEEKSYLRGVARFLTTQIVVSK